MARKVLLRPASTAAACPYQLTLDLADKAADLVRRRVRLLLLDTSAQHLLPAQVRCYERLLIARLQSQLVRYSRHFRGPTCPVFFDETHVWFHAEAWALRDGNHAGLRVHAGAVRALG